MIKMVLKTDFGTGVFVMEGTHHIGIIFGPRDRRIIPRERISKLLYYGTIAKKVIQEIPNPHYTGGKVEKSC